MKWILLALIMLAESLLQNGCATQTSLTFPRSAVYAYGIKPAASQASMNDAVQAAYADWLNRYVTAEGAPAGAYRIHRYTGNDYDYDTVSEGIAWGMLIASLMESSGNQTQKYFNGFWKYYKNYLNSAGLMSWKITKTGIVTGEDSATEADENAALALLYADKQWGSAGEINYLADAKNLIGKILSKEVEAGTYVLKPGAGWGGSDAVNPAYFDPAYYRIWKSYDSRWSEVLNKSTALYDIFYDRHSTGLFPDWTTATGTNSADRSYNFTYDACQVPLKIGIDFLWNGQGGKHLEKFSDWIAAKTGGSPEAIIDGYKLDGTTTGQFNNAAFVGPACVAAMASAKHQAWLDKLYTHLATMETGGKWGYYQDTLRLISLLIISGNLPNYW